MSEKFHAELAGKKKQILVMSAHSRSMLRDSMVALERNDLRLAESVKKEKRSLHILTKPWKRRYTG
jgi:hypothetical protein